MPLTVADAGEMPAAVAVLFGSGHVPAQNVAVVGLLGLLTENDVQKPVTGTTSANSARRGSKFE